VLVVKGALGHGRRKHVVLMQLLIGMLDAALAPSRTTSLPTSGGGG